MMKPVYFFASGIVGLLLAFNAFSATLPAQGDADKLLKQQKEQQVERERIHPPAQIKTESPINAEQIVEETPCFQINELAIKGHSQLSKTTINTLQEKFIRHCLGAKSINNLLASINRAYIQTGFITSRAYLPRQDLRSGILTIEIVEGFVETIELNKNSTRTDRWQLFFAMPQKTGELLQLRDLEQGLDQLNRLSSSQATLQLWPGGAPGSTNVQIEGRREDQTRFYAGWDNQGQTSTGEARNRLGLERDNAIGIGDAWSLYYIGSNNSNALALNLSVPWHYWTFSYSDAYSEYLSLLTPVAELFGRSRTQTLEADRVISRDQISNRHIKLRLTQHEADRFVAGVRLTPQTLTLISAGASQTWRNKTSFAAAELMGVKGIADWGATHDKFSGDEYPHAQFNKMTLQGSWFQALSERWQFRSKLTGQASDSSLYASEQVSVGDANTVRGFEETPISGDSGFYWQNELHFGFLPLEPLPDSAPRVDKWMNEIKSQFQFSTLYAFMDAARTRSRLGGLGNNIAGTGVGYRFGGKRLSFDISGARALKKPEGIQGGTAVYASVNIKLN